MENNYFDLKKALDTSATNGNSFLDPVLLSRIVTDQVRKMPVLRNMIKRLPWGTNYYTWDSILDHGAAQTAADGATLAFVDAKFAQNNAKMSYFYHLFAITNPAILATEELLDLVSTRLDGARKQLIRLEGSVIYNGDPINGSNPGLNSVLLASPTQQYVGANAVVSRALMTSIDNAMRSNGYPADVIVVSPNVYGLLSEVAFNQVRFVGTADAAMVGYSLSPTKALLFNGIPVIQDPYAVNYVSATAQSMVAGSGSTNFKFANSGSAVNGVQRVAGSNFAGFTWVAPAVTVGGSSVSNYAYQADGSITFTAAPSATPAASFTYTQDNVYFLSLDPQDLLIAEQMSPTVENDLGKPAQLDAQYFRVKEYATLAVRNPLAHVMLQNVSIPAVSNF